MRTGDAHRQGGKSINHLFQQHTIFPQIWFCFHSTPSKQLKYLFSFYSFKSLKLRVMWSKMTKGTIIVTNNVFRSTRPLGKGSSNMSLFSLQLMTLRSYTTNHTTMVASRNKLRSTQFPRMGPKQRLRLKSLSLHILISFMWRNVHQFVL